MSNVMVFFTHFCHSSQTSSLSEGCNQFDQLSPFSSPSVRPVMRQRLRFKSMHLPSLSETQVPNGRDFIIAIVFCCSMVILVSMRFMASRRLEPPLGRNSSEINDIVFINSLISANRFLSQNCHKNPNTTPNGANNPNQSFRLVKSNLKTSNTKSS